MTESSRPATNLGPSVAEVEAAMACMIQGDVIRRIWRKDHTVWKPDPREITDRLGWLNVTDLMHEQAPALEAFAAEARQAGFGNVVLLGMGGSSLGAEALRQAFGSAPGFPTLQVLDSIIPASVRAVSESIDPGSTLFLVSSKSGATTEPGILFKHFRRLVEAAGKGRPGDNFVAITDPGTPLEKLGREAGFRRTFLNPSDIGGRYSVLSYFGLVPAALLGVDIKALLDGADRVREACASCLPGEENPGLRLGVTLGVLALKGMDKLTVLASPSMSGLGLWAEQLVAESTGKEGKGIVPVTGEPLVDPSYYGPDRQFVYLRLKGDDNSTTDQAAGALRAAGQPLVVLNIGDKLDLGAEFFLWQFATAVAGAVLGIHPFNQPDVQSAKDATERLLGEYRRSGLLPQVETGGSVSTLLAEAAPGNYLAVMAYLRQTPETDAAFAALRKQVLEQSRIATTLGYGPRFLHSTGQLHKGGKNNGLFLQLTGRRGSDLPVPGEPYTFGVVADAQALGDLQALRALGRRVVSIDLSGNGPAAFSGLAASLR